MTATPSVPDLRLKTLGPTPRLVCIAPDGEEVLLLGPGKPLAIVVYLSMAPSRSASRVHLTDLLWADADLERARQSLRQAVWQVRRKVGESSLVANGELLTLRVPLVSDYADVGTALRDARYEEAIRLYEGDFLAEFGVPGGASFEHWADKARDRLRAGWMRALDAVARERLDRGAVREAITLARRHRDADPSNEAVWRFLLEALLQAGDPIGAAAEADALEALLAGERREPEPQTLPYLAKVRATPAAVEAMPATPALTAELIGREGEFRRITHAWERARHGTGSHLHLSAPAGLGKTRLLRDTERRLRAMGGRILYLRASPGSRRIAYAFAAELARSLVGLPGASGVTPSALATLQALDPALAAGFQGAPDTSAGPEALRRRTLALADLVLALAEEAPLALLVDDLHWMDGESVQVLAGLCTRVAPSATLIVTAGRPAHGQELIEADAELLVLAPLTASEVEALVMSLGAMPDAAWPALLVHRLHEASGGSPHLVLESLQFVLDRGSLVLDRHGWKCGDPGRLAEELPAGDALRRRVEALPAAARLVLSLLAMAAAPLRSRVLASAAGMPDAEITTLLSSLELRGFVAGVEDRWRLGHDALAEAALGGAGPEDEKDLSRRLGMVLVGESSISIFDHQRAAELLVQGGADELLAPLYRRWLAAAHRRRDPRGDLDLARALLGGGATPERLRRVLRARPLARRLGLDTPSKQWGAAGAGFLMVALLAVIANGTASEPARLVLLQSPISGNSAAIVPAPVVEVQDASGRRVRDAQVEVRMEAVGEPRVLVGTTSARSADGLATFNGAALTLDAPAGLTLRFSAKGMEPVSTRLAGLEPPALWLVHGRLNGQELTPTDRVLAIAPGEEIQGEVVLRYSSYWAAASVILGAFPTWGDRRESFVAVSALATPVINAISRHSVEVPGPDRPGDYHLIFAFAAETEARWIASGTNWAVGAPMWGDGNDLADLAGSAFDEANRSGGVQVPWYFEQLHRYDPMILAATVIEVRVR